jgi:hypothetical protein
MHTACHLAIPSYDCGGDGAAPRAETLVEAGYKTPLAAVTAAVLLMVQASAQEVQADPQPAPEPLGNPATPDDSDIAQLLGECT